MNPGTGQPLGPADLAPLFPMGIILQEVSQEPVIETGALPASMLAAWLVTLLAVMLLTGTLVATRYVTERNRELAEARRDRHELVRLESAAEVP